MTVLNLEVGKISVGLDQAPAEEPAMSKTESDTIHRVKPAALTLYLGMTKLGPDSTLPVRIAQACLNRAEAVVLSYFTPDKVLALTIDPDTLDVLSCVSEHTIKP